MLSPDIACQSCQIGGAAIDYNCVDCCLRMLAKMPDRDRVISHMNSMERFNQDQPGFSERLRKGWKEIVKRRSN